MYVLQVASTMTTDRFCVGRLAIDHLSDDLLIYIFKLYQREFDDNHDRYYTWRWLAIVHACKRWRRIIFAWPHHIDVRLYCKSGTAVTKALDVWPNLPISISSWSDHLNDSDGSDLIAALEHRDRIVGIDFSWGLSNIRLERCAALMQESFPFLRTLLLHCYSVNPPVMTDAFLGGSAPRLQELILKNIPFPTLPKLLLSAHGLVELHLEYFASTAYISSDVMATCMSVLPRLHCLSIIFRSAKSIPQVRRDACSLPPTRVHLPALSMLVFSGFREYSEDLMSRIDAPLLQYLRLTFFYQPIFDMPQLSRLISGTEELESALFASLDFHEDRVAVYMLASLDGSMEYMCTGLDKQISLLEQFWTQCLPHVGDLELWKTYNMKKAQQSAIPWLGFLRSFNALQVLSLHDEELEMEVARVLGELSGESVVEVLPILHTLRLTLDRFDRVEPLLKPFIDARQLSGHPVTMEWGEAYECGAGLI